MPVLEAVEEDGIEVRHYGPILAFATADAPWTALFNLVLGAERPGAVEDGHLAAALDWTESLGIDCRIPVRPDFGEPDAAEDLLNRRGYRRTATQAMFVRDAADPDFPEPPGIEVDELLDESSCEGFSSLLAAGYGMEWTGHGFFIGLPGRRGWRNFPERGSTGARNLVRAGFALGAARTVWRPSEHLLADEEDDRREDEDGEPDDDDGFDDDHDFELEGRLS